MITGRIKWFLFWLTGLALALGWLIGMAVMWFIMTRNFICT